MRSTKRDGFPTHHTRSRAQGSACNPHICGSVLACAYGPDGSRAASAAADGTVRVWARVAGPEPPKPRAGGGGAGGKGCAWELAAHNDADER